MRSKFWGPEITVTKRQIDFAIGMNEYRRKHNLSQAEMANICTLFGVSRGVKFAQTEISAYETLRTAPRPVKFQVLTDVIGKY